MNGNQIILGTHNKKFHLDEVLATAVLLNIYPEAKLLRTRDEKLLKNANIVYDVGAVYDKEILRFDHHQRTFTETFSDEYDVKLSSSGLVYRHFAKDLLEKFGINPTEEIINEIYEEYFLYADAWDNGINNPIKYKARTLADIVNGFNMPFATPEDEQEAINFLPNLIIPIEYKKTNENGEEKIVFSHSKRFKFALKYVMRDLNNYLRNKKETLDELEQVDELIKNLDGKIFICPKDINASRSVVFELNKKYEKGILFTIYQQNEHIRIYTMQESLDSFQMVCPLNLDWAGLRCEELQKKSGIKTATFVHASGFTGGAETLEDAIKMCEISMEVLNK